MLTAFEREVERHYRHNFLVSVLDGTFFWAGASLIASTTVLPLFVSHLTDSDLLIGLLSTIGSAGWYLPQLFTANWVQRLERKKVLPVNVGLFTERLPVILMAPTALLSARFPGLALALFFLLVTWHAAGAGLIAVAWQEMIAKIIPSQRRGKLLGITNFGGTATGVLGAFAAAWMLDRYSFPQGYVWCFALAGLLISLSWVFLAMTREPAQETDAPAVSQWEFFRRLPRVLGDDVNFGRFLRSRAVLAFGAMANGFLTVYAVQQWDLSDGQAGKFTTSMLLGQALSNLLFGALADRKGHKVVLEWSALCGMLSVGLAIAAPGPAWFYAVFALLGASQAGYMLSGLMIALEFCPAARRPTYIGLNNTVWGIASALAPVAGGWLADRAGYLPLFVVALLCGGMGYALLRWWVREPRRAVGLAVLEGTGPT